ncbi:hypothetical protein [Paenibacillus sp. GCM10012306]|uniref:hypothetical protein n=1 Tax=Paenibacillus sp. GCM10012306 TaxID=3317342 RepID=UPI0036090C38
MRRPAPKFTSESAPEVPLPIGKSMGRVARTPRYRVKDRMFFRGRSNRQVSLEMPITGGHSK